MSEILSGADALDALTNDGGSGGSNAEFSSFKSGSTYVVKVVDPTAIMRFYSYGIFKKVNSFVAKNPSKKSRAGNPVENLTPWDKAWKMYADKSEKFGDDSSQEAYKYKPKERYAMAFYDLDSGEPIIIDFSKKQGQAVYAVINENRDKLGNLAFKLSKRGESTSTTVSLSPYVNVDHVQKMKQAGIEVDDDLTDKQQANFDKAPEKYDENLFEGLLYEADEDEQIQLLAQAGFDVSLIGLEVPKGDGKAGGDSEEAAPVDNGEISDDDLPF